MACMRGSMVEVDGEVMTPEDYENRQGKDKDKRPPGYKEDLEDLKDCPEPLPDPEPRPEPEDDNDRPGF